MSKYLSDSQGAAPNLTAVSLNNNATQTTSPEAGKVKLSFTLDIPYFELASTTIYQLIYGDSTGLVASLNVTTATIASAVFNEAGASTGDVRIEGDTVTHLVFSDASADMVGVGTDTPLTRLHVSQESAATNSVVNVLTVGHNSSGTPASGLGAGVVFLSETSTTPNSQVARITADFSTVTHASRIGRLSLYASDSGGERLGVSISASGSAALVGLYSATPVIRYATTGTTTGFTSGASTAARVDSTYTGNTGATAYTTGDIVRALKLIGILTA